MPFINSLASAPAAGGLGWGMFTWQNLGFLSINQSIMSQKPQSVCLHLACIVIDYVHLVILAVFIHPKLVP